MLLQLRIKIQREKETVEWLLNTQDEMNLFYLDWK